MKVVEFPGGAKGAVGIMVIVLATMVLLNRFAPAKVRAFVQGA